MKKHTPHAHTHTLTFIKRKKVWICLQLQTLLDLHVSQSECECLIVLIGYITVSAHYEGNHSVAFSSKYSIFEHNFQRPINFYFHFSSILCCEEPSWIPYRGNYWVLSVYLYSIAFLSFKHVGVIYYWLHITYTWYCSLSAKNVEGSCNFLVWIFQAMAVLVLPSMSSKTFLVIWSVIQNSFLTPNLQ